MQVKKMIFAIAVLLLTVVGANAQTKKDGTPDMRYKANKETYGSGYSPSYSEPKQERNYDNGGSIKMQKGYQKSNGAYVQPHLKTRPDNSTWNNLSDPN